MTLRARFPNGQGVLLPGMFVRAKFTQAINQNAFLVPQQAISRDPKGGAMLFLLGPEGNKAMQRTVRADRTQGKYWVVPQGLKAGDKVITQGLAQLKPNQQVKAVPANTPERLQPPQQGKGQSGGGQGGSGQSSGRG